MKPRTLAQLSFSSILSTQTDRHFLPLYLRAKFRRFESDQALFQRLYLSEIRIDLPLECFHVEENLFFDPVETLKSIKPYLTPLVFFKLCATFGHADLINEAWKRLNDRQKVVMATESQKYLKVSPMQAEAIRLCGEDCLPQPLIACSSWFNVCAAVYCASRGWSISMARNLLRFANQELLFDEKVIECCLHAIKQDHDHVVLFLLRNSQFSEAFENPAAFGNPLRLFSLIDTKNRDESLVKKIDQFVDKAGRLDLIKNVIMSAVIVCK
ncbi:hypothetical protein L596_017083 [Steinernema carpocapsae]|uniref:Uncharacterized protein n=1 Tax=Steinernema carpocapsae TaxID=34508 RepID=A0A4U5N0F4_STECR|nr:hypothetical protein L596_017083 [Steinernema carpocapsae]